MVSGVTFELNTLLSAQGGVATSADLRALGLTRDDVRRLVAEKTLIRLRRGTFIDGRTWTRAKPWERHALRGRAVQRATRDNPSLAVSHHSALALVDVALHGVDDKVHLVTTHGGQSRPGDVLVVHAGIPHAFVRQDAEGRRSVTPAMACLQVAATFGVEAGLVSTESALRQSLCSGDDLAEALRALGPVIGCRSSRRVVELAGSLSESAGESRCRWVFLALGLPAPVQQASIIDHTGRQVGRVDFLFAEQRVIVEFDGLGKYGDIRDVHAEKVREDELRALGYQVVRLTWAELARPDVVGYKIHAAFALARARQGA